MRFKHALLSVTTLVVCTSVPALADAPPPPAEPTSTWECLEADGSSLYTNKEKAGCRALVLKPLSVVPSLDNMPIIPYPVAAPPGYQVPAYPDRATTDRLTVPDWARDWRASIAPGGSVQEEVCTLYSEWLHLVQKTRGGFFFGSDPSYGGDPSGRNLRAPSFSFYDNARWMALSRIFGTGFVPVGCP